MPKLVMTHAVADIERWLKGKDERAAAIGAVATNVTDHVAANGSNNVAITADVTGHGERAGDDGLALARSGCSDGKSRRHSPR